MDIDKVIIDWKESEWLENETRRLDFVSLDGYLLESEQSECVNFLLYPGDFDFIYEIKRIDIAEIETDFEENNVVRIYLNSDALVKRISWAAASDLVSHSEVGEKYTHSNQERHTDPGGSPGRPPSERPAPTPQRPKPRRSRYPA